MNNDSLRALERGSIKTFVTKHAHLFAGGSRVLDFGCGKQPYREIVEQAGGSYEGFDRTHFPANVSGEDIGPGSVLERDWDVILTNQTIQYVPPWELTPWLSYFRNALYVRRGVLLMTGPTCWPLVEPEDLCRYTPSGINAILAAVGFEEVQVEVRAPFKVGSVDLNCGWQVVAKAKV